MKSKKFTQKEYPHIDLRDAIPSLATGRLWPLCDLKFFGNCQNIAIVPSKIRKETYRWERPPEVKSCAECEVQQRNRERR